MKANTVPVICRSWDSYRPRIQSLIGRQHAGRCSSTFFQLHLVGQQSEDRDLHMGEKTSYIDSNSRVSMCWQSYRTFNLSAGIRLKRWCLDRLPAAPSRSTPASLQLALPERSHAFISCKRSRGVFENARRRLYKKANTLAMCLPSSIAYHDDAVRFCARIAGRNLNQELG